MRHILPASSYLIDNADSERVESIVDELRQLEVVCSPARDPSVAEGYLLVFFAKVSDSLLEIVETLKSRRVFCLCVAMGEGTIPSADVWRLLQAGASDEVIASNVTRMVKQFGRLRGRRMSAKIALSRRMEPLQTEADRNSGFKHYTLRNWALSGA